MYLLERSDLEKKENTEAEMGIKFKSKTRLINFHFISYFGQI
jgi:hypothetical protein